MHLKVKGLIYLMCLFLCIKNIILNGSNWYDMDLISVMLEWRNWGMVVINVTI